MTGVEIKSKRPISPEKKEADTQKEADVVPKNDMKLENVKQ